MGRVDGWGWGEVMGTEGVVMDVVLVIIAIGLWL